MNIGTYLDNSQHHIYKHPYKNRHKWCKRVSWNQQSGASEKQVVGTTPKRPIENNTALDLQYITDNPFPQHTTY